MSRRRYDLVIIGTGVAAGAAATPVRSAGWSVAVVDHRPFGGTCALRGCDPKRVLAGATELTDGLRRMRGRGITGESQIDWHELIAFKRTFTDPVPQQRETGYAEQGIDSFHGAPDSRAEAHSRSRATSWRAATSWSRPAPSRWRWVSPASNTWPRARIFWRSSSCRGVWCWSGEVISPPSSRTSRPGPALTSRCSSAASVCSKTSIRTSSVG